MQMTVMMLARLEKIKGIWYWLYEARYEVYSKTRQLYVFFVLGVVSL